MNEKILKNIKYYREEKGMSLQELSKKSNLSYSYLVKLEKGIKTNPSLDALDKITFGLGINIDILFEN